ncbi:MAL7P1.13-like protein [Cryptosporidium canis]|uniref:MAL7P1.13-like protein n=1 Tax=Cryptosporidium canis TaxID=195482 RepID=A0ABQ8P6P0_9CRYT|nr:MAL7P1.13-like protein [Cryptosporidium canis]KAJ1609990.1 MAL7P1.13-like protein [Cryptosporidium canis]
MSGSVGNVYQDDRISRLSQRLNSIHNGLDMDRSSKHLDRLAEIETSMKAFEEEMNRKYDEGMRKVSELRATLMSMRSENREAYSSYYLEAESRAGPKEDPSYSSPKSELHQAERRLNELLQSEIFSRKSMEQRLIEIIDDRMDRLRSEISKKDIEREELDSCVKRFVEVDIVRLGHAIKNEVEKCQSIESNVLAQLREEIERLNCMINEEVNTRQQSIDTLLDLMENLVQQITIDTRNERSERQNSEDTLLRLLEESLNRIQIATSGITKS